MNKKWYLVGLVLLILTACSPDMSKIDFGDADSPCEYTDQDVDGPVKVGGLLEFVDATAPDGWYADLERDGCRIGIWVESAFLTEWQAAQPEAFKEGAVAVFEGFLTSQPLPDRPDEYQLIVEVDQPPFVLLDSSGKSDYVEHSMPACDFSDLQSGEEANAKGEIILADDSAAAGVYFELDEAGCFKRVWVERRFYDQWTSEQQKMISVGNLLEVNGILTDVRGEPTVDIKDPPIQR